MNMKQTKSLVPRKHPLEQAAPCSVTHMPPLSAGKTQWGKGQMWTQDYFLSRQNISWKKNSEKCIHLIKKKAGKRNPVTINNTDCYHFSWGKNNVKTLHCQFLKIFLLLSSNRGTEGSTTAYLTEPCADQTAQDSEPFSSSGKVCASSHFTGLTFKIKIMSLKAVKNIPKHPVAHLIIHSLGWGKM